MIDISGDGANNWGRIVVEARIEAVAAGMTINGLPIVNDRPSRFGRRQIPNLDLYYENCVIGGRSAFIVVAQGFEDFAEAVLRKLILEIAGVMPSRRPRTTGPRFKVAEERLVPSCTTGEEYWPFRDDF